MERLPNFRVRPTLDPGVYKLNGRAALIES